MDAYIMIPSALVLFAMGYGALSSRLDRVWGVDPSRMTPAYENGKQKSVFLLLARDILAYMAFLLPGGNAASLGFVPEQAVLYPLALAGVLTCLGGVLSYAALFVSLRHAGEGIGAVLEEEIGPAASKAFHFVSLLFALAASAICLRYFLSQAAGFGVEAAELPAACRCAVLMGLFACMPSALSAARLGSEADGGPLCMGGALLAGLLAVLLLASSGVLALAMRFGIGFQSALLMEKLIAAASHLCAMVVSLHLAAYALRGLLKRSVSMRRKKHKLLGAAAFAVVFAAAAGLACVDAAWLCMLAAGAGAAAAAAVFSVCVLWFTRIGRRMI